MEKVKIISPQHAIESMQDSGYKDAAHAVAELIDNSIQAGEDVGRTTSVELICVEKQSLLNQRRSNRIEQIAVYDNASGMSGDILSLALAFGQGTRKGSKKGMGRFGMGLPNASISQCNRVEVWTWQNGDCHHSYLDIDEIRNGRYDTVPLPQKVDGVPVEWQERIQSEIADSGTLVVWSKLERMKWKRHKAFFANTEFIVGRMYRYFIRDGKAEIRMLAFEDGANEPIFNEITKPNDPLYLMENTQAPNFEVAEKTFNYSDEPAFVLYAEKKIPIEWGGETHDVTLKFSEARQEFRRYVAEQGKNPGDTAFGKQCGRNQGISIVRAGRELEINKAFEISYDPVERFWGAEVSFEPPLDEVFGVTNDKQAATAFRNLSLSEIADEEELPPGEMDQLLFEDCDPRRPVIQISDEIDSVLKAIRKDLDAQTSGVKLARKLKKGKDRAGDAATKQTEGDGAQGKSDLLNNELSDDEKKQQFEEELERDGVSAGERDKDEILKSWQDDSKYIFSSAEIRGSYVIFDVSQPGGKIKVTFNKKHPAYESFIDELEEEDGHGFDTLKLLFAAWARAEDRLSARSEEEAERMEDLRVLWGGIARDMLKEYES